MNCGLFSRMIAILEPLVEYTQLMLANLAAGAAGR